MAAPYLDRQIRRLDDYVFPGLPTHQQIRARRVRLFDCPCTGCRSFHIGTLYPPPHPVMVGATEQAVFGPPVEHPPRRAA